MQQFFYFCPIWWIREKKTGTLPWGCGLWLHINTDVNLSVNIIKPSLPTVGTFPQNKNYNTNLAANILRSPFLRNHWLYLVVNAYNNTNLPSTFTDQHFLRGHFAIELYLVVNIVNYNTNLLLTFTSLLSIISFNTCLKSPVIIFCTLLPICVQYVPFFILCF